MYETYTNRLPLKFQHATPPYLKNLKPTPFSTFKNPIQISLSSHKALAASQPDTHKHTHAYTASVLSPSVTRRSLSAHHTRGSMLRR